MELHHLKPQSEPQGAGDGERGRRHQHRARRQRSQGPTINATWADSPQVLAATNGHRDPSASLVNLMVLGYGQPGAGGDAAWGINFNAGTNQIVRWNGDYIGEG